MAQYGINSADPWNSQQPRRIGSDGSAFGDAFSQKYANKQSMTDADIAQKQNEMRNRTSLVNSGNALRASDIALNQYKMDGSPINKTPGVSTNPGATGVSSLQRLSLGRAGYNPGNDNSSYNNPLNNPIFNNQGSSSLDLNPTSGGMFNYDSSLYN